MVADQAQDKSLIEKLADKQRAERKSDAEFAGALGMTRSWWNLARNGKAIIGDRVLGQVSTTYPDLDSDILAFLRAKANAARKAA